MAFVNVLFCFDAEIKLGRVKKSFQSSKRRKYTSLPLFLRVFYMGGMYNSIQVLGEQFSFTCGVQVSFDRLLTSQVATGTNRFLLAKHLLITSLWATKPIFPFSRLQPTPHDVSRNPSGGLGIQAGSFCLIAPTPQKKLYLRHLVRTAKPGLSAQPNRQPQWQWVFRVGCPP